MAEYKKMAEEIITHIPWDGMEFYLYNDGNYGFRQQGSFGENEDEIETTLPLGDYYWNASPVTLKTGKEVNFAEACNMLNEGYEEKELKDYLIEEIINEIKNQI